MKAFVMVMAAMMLGAVAWAEGGHQFGHDGSAMMPCHAMAGKQLQALNEFSAPQGQVKEMIESWASGGQDEETPLETHIGLMGNTGI